MYPYGELVNDAKVLQLDKCGEEIILVVTSFFFSEEKNFPNRNVLLLLLLCFKRQKAIDLHVSKCP